MNVSVNGENKHLNDDCTVAELIEMQEESTGGIAVAINGKLVRRDSWNSFKISENDNIVIIKAAYGG